MYWPRFEEPFLHDVVLGLKKRSKALKHKSLGLSCERVRERNAGDWQEIAELKITGFDGTLEARLWSERWIWVHAGQGGNNRWSWTSEGRLVGDCGGRQLVATFEETLSAMFEMDETETAYFDDIWRPLIAQGPRLVSV